MDAKQKLLEELGGLIQRGQPLAESYKQDGMSATAISGVPEWTIREFVTSASASIDRIAGRDSQFYRQVVLQPAKQLWATPEVVMSVVGSLRALHEAVENDWLATMAEILHADLFGDFLDMADHLLSEGYKDPAAVLSGGVLEEHLRRLCAKHTIPTDTGGRPKKVETMNAELAAASAYSKADQKNITAWWALRNEAAHAKYAAYGAEQVRLMTQSVRDFVTRVRA